MKDLINDIINDLLGTYSPQEARELAFWIVEETLGVSRTQILTGYKVTKNIPNYKVILQRILKKEPIQYIFGHTEWCGLDLRVTPATLIPRPETAELVDAIAALAPSLTPSLNPSALSPYPTSLTPSLPTRGFPDGEPTANRQQADGRPTVDRRSKHTLHIRCLDVGTGSGCIAIALKKRFPDWDISAMDISSEALAVARENAQHNNADIHFFQGDIFTDEIGDFDIIVSNPPYVLDSEKSTMETNVLDYEPSTALFVPDSDPLRYYRRIAALRKAPYIAFEINRQMGADMVALMQQLGYTDIHLQKDTYGNDRILLARLDC
ncbi:MAG: peptide chain release factor N(5)-glutamine methyltransferase [Paludibacteraceae bacterium]|nr:peptide chain release factor N(5)-glutamine methyltransferase [Paludibacteraceae bacterium]